MTLPEHVRGWNIPAHEARPPLAAARIGSPWGWIYKAGIMSEGLTGINPEHARAWIEEAEHGPGITLLTFKTERGKWDQFRAAAAVLYYCAEDNSLAGHHRFILPRYEIKRTNPHTLTILQDLGFRAVYASDDLTASAEIVCDIATEHYPELAQAAAFPSAAPATPAGE